MTDETVLASLQQGHCPDCGGTEWFDGPRGGMSHNVCCTACGSAFNISPSFFGGPAALHWGTQPMFAERISNDTFKASLEKRRGAYVH